MRADELKRGMKVRYNSHAYVVFDVQPPDVGNPKRGIEPACKFQFRTRMDHFGTTISVKMPPDEEVEVL